MKRILQVVCPSCGAGVDQPCKDRRQRRDGSHPDLRTPHARRAYLASPHDFGTGEA